MINFSKLAGFTAAAAGLLAAGGARASGPVEWGTYLQPAATQVARDIHAFGGFTFWIVGVIVLFVLALLVVVMVRFNARANPTPSRTSHNTLIEVVWTVVPILVLLAIAVPSFRLLYEERVIPDAQMTLKVTGVKWNWNYEYPDNGGINFSSYMLADDAITDPATQRRNLSVDYPVVVPIGEVVRIQVTAEDVIHSFAMQPFGVKIDAIPGRLNESWFKVDEPGIYYGQCSELCGQNHAFMPIEIRAVTAERFQQWADAAKTDIDAANKLLTAWAEDDAHTTKVAAR